MAWQFDRRGVVLIERGEVPDEDRILEVVLEAGADDLTVEVTSGTPAAGPPGGSGGAGGGRDPVASAELTMVPQATVPLQGGEIARRVLSLIEALDELDDVQSVRATSTSPTTCWPRSPASRELPGSVP